MSAEQFLVTTTGTPATVVINDLNGLTLVHPVVDQDLLDGEHSRHELSNSTDLQAAITGGEVTVTDQDGNAITNVKDWLNASQVGYDNGTSGLVATDVQAAIDELSVAASIDETYTESFGRDRRNVNNQWLDRVGGAPCNEMPFVVPYDGQLVKIVASTDGAETYDAEVYENADVRTGGVPLDGNKIAELVVTAADSALSGDLAVAVSAGDEIGVFIRGTGIRRPGVTLVFRRT